MFKERKNKVETIIKTSEELPSSRLNGSQRLKESSLILAVLFAIFLAIALFSFNPADPSWSQTAWGSDIHNVGGLAGAWLADTLFFIFGCLAYPLPVIVAAMAWVTLRTRDQDEQIDFTLWATKLLGLTILLLTSCGLADINFDDIWYFSSGGVIGDVLTSLALPTLNLLGTTLVLLFSWGAGFTLLTGISWLRIVEWIGERSISAFIRVLSRLRGEKSERLIPELIKPELVNADLHQPELLSAELEPPLSATSEVALVEPTLNSRRFNIHMPEARDSAPIDPSSLRQPEPPAPEVIIAEPARFSTRTQQWDATIEELDQQARLVDDYADELAEQNSITHLADNPVSPVITSDDETSDEPFSHSFNVDIADEESEPRISNMDWSEEELDELPAISMEPELDAQDDDQFADSDVSAFQNIVAQAQASVAAKQNPFLVQQAVNLPKPTEPMPTLELLYHPEKRENFIDREALEEIARLVEAKLADYKIQAQVVDIFPGPVITRFELDLAPGVKVSRISSLSMDLARSLSAMAVRVVEVIPGKPYVGLELPNMSRQTVYLSDVIASAQFKESKSPTSVVLGQDIAGDAVVVDLAKMPHVLVAGTTGSGKSVGVNVMILSMLYKASPEEVRFIMIDPKMLELSVYEGIPHLLAEVVTDMKDAANALRWCVGEMERRYKLMSVLGVRNIKGFNDKLRMAAEAGHPIYDPLWKEGDSMESEPPLLEKLPYIVVVVDEFADLMMVVGKKVEELIARLAQKARAAGIHLILATQRPSVDVITGLIKANIPTRVAFTVSTKTDSRTILDQSGAESLLGMGDMLYLPPGSSHTIRVHGAFASDDDVHAVVNNWKARGKPNYISEIIQGDHGPEAMLPGEQLESDEDLDPLFDQVVEHVVETRRGSVSGVQRRFKIGYNRAARIVEQLEAQGIVSSPGHNGNRDVLAPAPMRD
ncbi:MAG: DNA translocase FtsK 4TM domain-containing protein [Vibrio sp.]|uniref:DNA translocase FtsK n=1 Tax=Vibrio chanodichtyis TaxID=3027932 RepID=A0ABT5UW58_9VIBR|nr:DNA translocase FtsK 4TM domain-containing protein [Vibrio chanodichtyis]MDE1513574.1 DNA translocase FtsK 4TM domain-containing protein [Vibrio chanodichtyis]